MAAILDCKVNECPDRLKEVGSRLSITKLVGFDPSHGLIRLKVKKQTGVSSPRAWRPSWISAKPAMGFMGTFSMVNYDDKRVSAKFQL